MSTHVLSCAASVFQTSPDDSLIRSICKFTYYEHFTPPPAVLETQDEILLANLPPKWQLVCDNQINRPIPLDSVIYAIVNKNYLCTCGISAQHIFLYESMHICTTPDASVTLYYTHNKALLAYDTSLQQQKDKDTEQYHINVPEYRALDISYQKKPPDLVRSSNLKVRKEETFQIHRYSPAMSLLMTFFPCHFIYLKQLTSWKQAIHFTYHLHSKYVNDQSKFLCH